MSINLHLLDLLTSIRIFQKRSFRITIWTTSGRCPLKKPKKEKFLNFLACWPSKAFLNIIKVIFRFWHLWLTRSINILISDLIFFSKLTKIKDDFFSDWVRCSWSTLKQLSQNCLQLEGWKSSPKKFNSSFRRHTIWFFVVIN